MAELSPQSARSFGFWRIRSAKTLFRRSGRNLVLTEAGHLALSYAGEIFSIGRELMNALKHRPGTRPLQVNVGLTDSFPKLIAFEILKAAFRQGNAIHFICREGELAALVH